jgi:hypothetical protein
MYFKNGGKFKPLIQELAPAYNLGAGKDNSVRLS